MKIRNLLIACLATAAIAAIPFTSKAAWITLDDFDGYAANSILAGQGGWTLSSGSANTSTVVADPTDASNLAGRIKASATGGQTIYRALGTEAIANNTTSTLFFRFYSTSSTPNFNLGMTDVAVPANATYSVNQSQFRVGGNAGKPGTLDTNDGAFKELGTYSTGTWYNMWVVVNNTANSQTFYRSTGTDAAALLGPANPYSFRVTTANSIQTLQLITNHATDSVLIDDVYISSGVNTSMIPEPATFGMLGVMGIAMLLRRRMVRG